MKKILLTGGTGFIGQNILPILRESYEVFAPTRKELDINSQTSIDNWFCSHGKMDFLVHCAIVNPSNLIDQNRNVLIDTLKTFFYLTIHKFQKIVYIGSGAEYDKLHDISYVSEDDIGIRIPSDEYGLVKYTLNQIARASKNIVNLRIFGCYGPAEPERRFIRHAIDCCLKNEPITIRQNCNFSYVFVKDLARAVKCVLESKSKFHDYNIVSNNSYMLSELAEMVKKQMGSLMPIKISETGMNKAYTANNKRFKQEFSDFYFTSIEQGISEQIIWQRSL